MFDEKKYLDKTGLQHVFSGMKAKLAGKSDIDHTHEYAGSSTVGGSATSAERLDTAAAGSATQPVYFANGKPVATTYTLGKSVPADAVFTDTDTHYASKNVVGGSADTDDTATAIANGGVYLNSVENGAVTSAHKISGTGATTVTADASGNIIINSTEHPTSIKNPNTITISLNGTSQGAYDGSAAKSINVTASSVGAYAKSEVDSKLSTKYGNDVSRTKNTVLAAPATANGAASFRALTAADIPAVNASAINGTIAAANLPSFVDDVLEGYYNSSDSKFYKNYNAANKAYSDVYTGETGKIYVDLADNKTYRWGGSSYVVISDTIALGETSTTAYRGDYGKAAYDHAVAHGSAFDSGLYKVQTNSEGHVTGATAVVKEDITGLGIPAQDTVYTHPTTSGNRHIPSGGSDGQVLCWSDDGTAEWGDMQTVNAVAPLEVATAPTAADETALAIGCKANAQGKQALSAGYGANSSPYSSAIGYGAKTDAWYSAAIGSEAIASNFRSIAIGQQCSARGDYATALGYGAKATAAHATAIGDAAIADKEYTVSFGSSSNKLEVVHIADPTEDDSAATKSYVDSIGEEKLSAAEAAATAANAAADRANAAAGAALQGLTWAKVSDLVKSGDASKVFAIGSQFTTKLSGNGYSVEKFAWDVVHHFDGSDDDHPLVTLESGEQVKGMMLQAHRTVPWSIVWEPKQAAIAVTGDMPAGTYHLTVKVTVRWGSGVAGAVGETSYQFTTAQALSAGAQLVWDASDTEALTSLTAYAGPTSSTAIETCAVTQGTGGTDLGVMTDGTPSTNATDLAALNNIERACYGSNRWSTSQERVALNATGAIAQGGDKFSRPWGLVGKTGLLGCLPAEFTAVLGSASRKQELHPWDGGAVEETFDKVFPVSAREHNFVNYLAATTAGYQAEGVPLDYWTQLAAASGVTQWRGWVACPELITYDSVATTTSRHVWLRSAYRGAYYASSAGGVYTSGDVGALYATDGFFAAPACLIV